MVRYIQISVFIGLVIFLNNGCYPVSHIIVGEKRDPINPSDVKVYADYPQNYERIAIIEAGSGFAFKDPAILFTHQSKTNKSLDRLKNGAAILGANGIVINDLSTSVKQHLNISENDKGEMGISSYNETQKEIKAIAIFVD